MCAETKRLGERLQNLCIEYRNGERALPQFLEAVAHNIRFGVERVNL